MKSFTVARPDRAVLYTVTRDGTLPRWRVNHFFPSFPDETETTWINSWSEMIEFMSDKLYICNNPKVTRHGQQGFASGPAYEHGTGHRDAGTNCRQAPECAG